MNVTGIDNIHLGNAEAPDTQENRVGMSLERQLDLLAKRFDNPARARELLSTLASKAERTEGYNFRERLDKALRGKPDVPYRIEVIESSLGLHEVPHPVVIDYTTLVSQPGKQVGLSVIPADVPGEHADIRYEHPLKA